LAQAHLHIKELNIIHIIILIKTTWRKDYICIKKRRHHALTMAGNLLAMPAILINMGGEMLYILEQRLKAQKIPEQKGQKVIVDIVKTMFFGRFVSELFKAQEIYSLYSTRHIFERLAHSSIMKLNESSMDKLFDLMTMGFKSQLVWSSCPEEITQINMNHHAAIVELVDGDPQLLHLLSVCESQLRDFYENLSSAKFQQLREELLYHFQERKVKISLFLQDENQNLDGSIVVRSRGLLPPFTSAPGMITYTDGRQVHIHLANSGRYAPKDGATKRISNERYSILGTNLYVKEKTYEGKVVEEPTVQSNPIPLPAPRDPEKGVKELDKLAEILGTSKQEDADQNFRLNFMFAGDIWSQKEESDGDTVKMQVLRDGHQNHTSKLEKLRDSMTNTNTGDPPINPEEAELLSLIE